MVCRPYALMKRIFIREVELLTGSIILYSLKVWLLGSYFFTRIIASQAKAINKVLNKNNQRY